MKLGERIKELRKAKGLTQAELGQLLGVSASMIGQYENGFRYPKKETLTKIAEALSIDYEDILIGVVSTKEIAAHFNLSIKEAEDILSKRSSAPTETQLRVFQFALSRSMDLFYKSKNLEDLYSSALDRISQITPEGILAAAGDSLKDMSVHISPDSVARAAEEVFYQQANKSLTVEEIKNAFRGKSIEELSEILAAVSKEISEQAAQVSSSND